MVMQPDLSALVNSSKLLACLVLHNFERDKAIGLGRPGKLTSDLAWHYHRGEREFYQDAFALGYIQQCSKTITALVDAVDETTDEATLIETGKQVELLNQAIKDAQSQIGLIYGNR